MFQIGIGILTIWRDGYKFATKYDMIYLSWTHGCRKILTIPGPI